MHIPVGAGSATAAAAAAANGTAQTQAQAQTQLETTATLPLVAAAAVDVLRGTAAAAEAASATEAVSLCPSGATAEAPTHAVKVPATPLIFLFVGGPPTHLLIRGINHFLFVDDYAGWLAGVGFRSLAGCSFLRQESALMHGDQHAASIDGKKLPCFRKPEPNINGDSERGSAATIERRRAEAIQVNGDPDGGQYGDNREKKSRGYTSKRGSRGGSTATIERGRAEAIQVNGDPEGEKKPSTLIYIYTYIIK
jgi:hypothetical protein